LVCAKIEIWIPRGIKVTCPDCQTEQPEGARFCNSCGAELTLTNTPFWSVSAPPTPKEAPKRPKDYLAWLGILITVGPALGYSMAFLKEWGFCTYFKIPADFIQLDTTHTLVAVGQGLGLAVIVLVYLLWYYVSDIAPGAKGLDPQKRRFYFGLIILTCAAYLCVVSGLKLNEALIWWILLVVLVSIIIVFVTELVWISISLRKTPGLRHKYEKWDRHAAKDALLDFVMQNISRSALIVVAVAVMILWVSFSIGRMTAVNQDDFLLPSDNASSVVLSSYSDNTSLVVLRVYGDELVCAPLNTDNRSIEPSFFIVKLDDEPRPVLNLEHIGRLKPPSG
jgi:hypothetical protein